MNRFAALFAVLALSIAGSSLSAHANLFCQETFLNKTPELFSPKSTLRTPDSAEAVAEIRSKLKELLSSDQSPVLRKMYGELRAEIRRALKLADSVKAKGYPMKEVAELVDLYSQIRVFPAEFMTWFADSVTGGCANVQCSFDEPYFHELSKERRMGQVNAEKNIVLYGKHYRKQISKPLNSLAKKFEFAMLRGTTPEEFLQDFIFQYRYVFRIGYQPMIDFFLVRETGEVFIGIPKDIRADYDGNEGTMDAFIDHDFFHASQQKVLDQQLFKHFKVDTLEKATALKALTHAQVKALVLEWSMIKDPLLKTAVETMLFVFTHEQALSYPLQVAPVYASKAEFGYYVRGSVSSIKNGSRFGLGVKQLLAGKEERYVLKALQWIKPRVEKADAEVRKQITQMHR